MGRNIFEFTAAERERLWQSLTEHTIEWLKQNNVAGSGPRYSIYVAIQDCFLTDWKISDSDVVEIGDDDPVFAGCLMIVSDVGSKFVRGEVVAPASPRSHTAPYRTEIENVRKVGRLKRWS